MFTELNECKNNYALLSLFFRALRLTKNCFGQKATLCLNQEKRMLFKEKRAYTDFTDMLKMHKKDKGNAF